MKFSITDFFNKCDQVRSFLRIWSHLLKKSVIENFIFCAVTNELDDMHVVGNIWLFWWNTNVVFSKKDKKGFILTTFKQINPL